MSAEPQPTPRALSFGGGAAEYDRARPDYPAAALDLAMSGLGLDTDADVLDLGAGTGKLTRPLVERVGRVTAIEPDPGMRAVLARVTDCYLVLEGTAEAIPLADRSVDAVFVGQAFHWFDTEPALHEIERVLRPRGGLALLWNTWWGAEQPPLPPRASELLRRNRERPELESLSGETDRWESSFGGESPFEALREEAMDWYMTLDAERLVTAYLSTSACRTLAPAELEPLEAELRRLVAGDYRLPIRTELCWTRLAEPCSTG